MFLTLLATSVVLLFAYLLLLDWKQRQKFAALPGPTPLPILGHIHLIDRNSPYKTFEEWTKKYGGVFKVFVLGQVYVIANDYHSVREMLLDKGVEFGGRPHNYRTKITLNNTGILRRDIDPKWRTIRRLTHSSIKAFGPGMSRIEQYAMQLSEEFIQDFKDANEKPIDPLQILNNTIIRMITIMTFGRKLDESSPIFQKIKDMVFLSDQSLHIGGDGSQLDMFPIVRYFGNKSYKLLQQVIGIIGEVWEWYNIYVAPVDEHELDDKLGKPLVKVLNDHNKNLPEGEAQLSEDDIKATAMQMLFAGVVSTSVTFYEIILAFLHYPEVKKRMYKEIQEVLGDRSVTLKDRDKMPYTHAVMYEVFRYNTGAPLPGAHKTICDATLGGHMVPKNTVVYFNMWTVHMDEKFWGDPYKFRPERFLDENGQLLSPEHEIRKRHIIFGIGPRSCAGKLFAMYRLFLWAVTLLQRFDIEQDPNNPPAPDIVKNYRNVGVTLRPPNYKAKFIPRENIVA